ncbi:hypothetical protein H8356DRAFT_1326485 [Neocallimastix lanati (nom. inval.)]|nr:hypothetical protein H8356DRAFT_1326485 [Neocallimastix sp. JGI-2020a]
MQKKALDIWNDLIINYMNNRDEFSEDENKISKSENSNNNLIDSITEDDINEMELIENINNAYSLLNENNKEIHICMLFNFVKDDNKEFDEDRTEEIDFLLEDIDQMNINKVYEEDNTYNDEIKNNSKILLKLRNAFSKKLKKEYFNDNEIQSIQIIDECNIKSSNIINLDYLNVDKRNFITYISNDIKSKSYIKLFFDNMKIKVMMLDEN